MGFLKHDSVVGIIIDRAVLRKAERWIPETKARGSTLQCALPCFPPTISITVRFFLRVWRGNLSFSIHPSIHPSKEKISKFDHLFILHQTAKQPSSLALLCLPFSRSARSSSRRHSNRWERRTAFFSSILPILPFRSSSPSP